MKSTIIKIFICLSVVLIFCNEANGGSDIPFRLQSVFSTNSVAEMVQIVDMDGDGRKDVVVAGWQYGTSSVATLNVFRQNALGQLDPPTSYKTFGGARSIGIGDLNHDGKPDVVVSYGSGGVEVFPQTQAGLLGPSASYPASNAFAIKVADLNNDGRDDVIGVGFDGIDLLFQNATGSLNAPVTYTIANVDTTVMSVAVGDLNNDGLNDIVVPSWNFTGGNKHFGFWVMFQAGDGTFGNSVWYPLNLIFAFPVVVVVGDINGDGLNDVVVTAGQADYSLYPNLYVYRQNNQRTLDLVWQSTLPLEEIYMSSIALSDINKDGRLDIAMAGGGATWVAFQKASGQFPEIQDFALPFLDINGAEVMAVGDTNGDGLPDIAVASYNDGLVILYQAALSPAIYSDKSPMDFGMVSAGGVAQQTVTITNYGRASLNIGRIAVEGGTDGSFSIQSDTCSLKSVQPYTQCKVTVSFQPSSGSYKKAKLSTPSDDPERGDMKISLFGNVPPKNIFHPWAAWYTGSSLEAIAIGDLNGDGKNDVAMTSSCCPLDQYGQSLMLFDQDPAGHLLPPVKYSVERSNSKDIMTVGDIDKDGKLELFLANGGYGLWIYHQNESGGLGNPVVYPSIFSNTVKVGDFNSDGFLDVAEMQGMWPTYTQQYNFPAVRVLYQSPEDGSFSPSEYYVPFRLGQMATGDINGDGLDDVISIKERNAGDCPDVAIFTQKIDGTLLGGPRYYCSQHGAPYAVTVGDVNGDKRQDVVFTYGWNQGIGILLQRPDGSLAPEIGYDSYGSPNAVRVADLDGDGRNEIIVLHGQGGSTAKSSYLGVYFQDSDGTLRPEELYELGYATRYNPEGFEVGDFNGDGLPDIAIANYNYGLIYLYQKGPGPGPQSQRLTVTMAGTGQGTVKGPGSNICRTGVCSSFWRAGSQVSISAEPDAGSVFSGWSGVTGCDGYYCAIVLNTDAQVTATFNATPYTLKVALNGAGTVKATGLTCSGTSCSGTFYYNNRVSLTAVPDGKGSSISWTGCTSSTGNTCSVLVKGNVNVGVTFVPNPCSYAISPVAKTFSRLGGSAVVNVVATGAVSCGAPVVSVTSDGGSWITPTLVPLKKNRGSVRISIPANGTVVTREGTVTIGNAIFHITQPGVPCALNSLTPSAISLPSSEQSKMFSVHAVTGCAWTAGVQAGETWLSVDPPTAGSGNGNVAYSLSQNATGRQRTGKIKVYLSGAPTKSRIFTVRQNK